MCHTQIKGLVGVFENVRAKVNFKSKRVKQKVD